CAGFEIPASEVVRFYLLHRLRVRRRFEYGLPVAVKSTTPPGWAYPLCARRAPLYKRGEKNFLLKSLGSLFAKLDSKRESRPKARDSAPRNFRNRVVDVHVFDRSLTERCKPFLLDE